jgi:hypothetical protein
LALLGRLSSVRVDGGIMQASEKPAQQRTRAAQQTLLAPS